MKILLVYPSPLSNVFFQTFIEAFIAAGHEVGVCTAPTGGGSLNYAALPAGTALYEIDLPRGASFGAHIGAVRSVREVVKSFRPDIVHAHMSAAVFTTAIARQWSQPTIGTFHGLMYPLSTGMARRIIGLAERTSIRRLDQVQVVNQHDYEVVRRDCPKVNCVRLRAGFGCDLTRFSPDRFGEQARADVRRQLDLRSDDVVGAFVGRMVGFKGIPTLVRAFRRVAELESRAKLVVVGDRDGLHPTGLSPEEDAWLRATNAVRVTGFTDCPERYLYASDYLVLPSGREGLSTAIMEALCMGLPVVTTTARGCGDLVDDARTGRLVPPEDARALEGALLETIRDPAARRQQGRAALGHRAGFDRQECVREMLDIYNQFRRGWPSASHERAVAEQLAVRSRS